MTIKLMNYTRNDTHLTDQELQTMTGEFLNRDTGNVWKVYVKDADLMVEVPHFNFQLTPLSATRFKPANSQVKMEVEFQTVDQGCFMYVYVQGSERAIFEAI